jgi:hypothetical protein
MEYRIREIKKITDARSKVEPFVTDCESITKATEIANSRQVRIDTLMVISDNKESIVCFRYGSGPWLGKAAFELDFDGARYATRA